MQWCYDLLVSVVHHLARVMVGTGYVLQGTFVLKRVPEYNSLYIYVVISNRKGKRKGGGSGEGGNERVPIGSIPGSL